MSEPARSELSSDSADFLTGPVHGEAARTEGGTTRDGGVAKFGASRTGKGAPEGEPSPAPDSAT